MYAIIGAGPMGLCTARQLHKHGIDFVGFELHADVGGLWDIDNPHSTMYDSAHLISSKGTTQFSEFPMRAEVAPYPHHSEMRRYFRDYAEHFGLYAHYQFNTRVVAIQRLDKGWKLISEQNGVQREWLVDGVLMANGTLHTPNQPALPGAFTGDLMHSIHYPPPARPPNPLGGATKLPRPLKQFLDGLLVRALVGKPSQYGLPDPDYKLYESHPVMNSLVLHYLGHGDIQARRDVAKVDGLQVTFSDGEQAEYDLILQGTGYKLDYPFIDRAHLNWPSNAGAPQLYLNVFHPEYDDLFMLGMVEASGLGWQGRDEQAELVALYIKGLQAGSQAAKDFQALKRERASMRLDGGYQYLQLERMAYYVHKDSYRQSIAQHSKSLRAGLAMLPATASRTVEGSL